MKFNVTVEVPVTVEIERGSCHEAEAAAISAVASGAETVRGHYPKAGAFLVQVSPSSSFTAFAVKQG